MESQVFDKVEWADAPGHSLPVQLAGKSARIELSRTQTLEGMKAKVGFIDMQNITTHQQILRKAYQMLSINAATPRAICQFIDRACAVNKLPLGSAAGTLFGENKT